MAGFPTQFVSTAISLNSAFRGLSLRTTSTTLSLSKRSFSASTCLQKVKTLPKHIPQYPYKPNYQYKQSDSGLYAGVAIRFGNKISKGRNKGKTRRSWKPNVRWKKMHSEALEKEIFVKLTRKALRTIRKCGGLDRYLLSDKPSRIKELGLTGWKLRYRIMQTPKMKEKFAAEREALGLPQPPKFSEWLEARKLDQQKIEAAAGTATEEVLEFREIEEVFVEKEDELPHQDALRSMKAENDKANQQQKVE